MLHPHGFADCDTFPPARGSASRPWLRGLSRGARHLAPGRFTPWSPGQAANTSPPSPHHPSHQAGHVPLGRWSHIKQGTFRWVGGRAWLPRRRPWRGAEAAARHAASYPVMWESSPRNGIDHETRRRFATLACFAPAAAAPKSRPWRVAPIFEPQLSKVHRRRLKVSERTPPNGTKRLADGTRVSHRGREAHNVDRDPTLAAHRSAVHRRAETRVVNPAPAAQSSSAVGTCPRELPVRAPACES
jgi:hypothetical protein